MSHTEQQVIQAYRLISGCVGFLALALETRRGLGAAKLRNCAKRLREAADKLDSIAGD